METLRDKLKKKNKLQELEKMANVSSNAKNNYTNNEEYKKINPTVVKVQHKFNQIMNDAKLTAQNFGLGVSTSFKNTMNYIETSTANIFDSYRRQDAMQQRLKEQQASRELKGTGSKKEINIGDIRDGEKGTISLIQQQPKETIIQQEIGKSLEKDEKQIQENIENTQTKVGKKFAELAPSMAQTVTGMGLSAVNPYLGTAFFQTSASGAYEREARAKGMNNDQAFKYGTIMGALEGVTESVGATLTTNLGKKFFGEGVEEGLKAYGLNLAENALEEAVMEPLSEYVTQITGGQADWSNMQQRVLEAGFNGALSSIILGGASASVGSAIKLIDKMQNGERITQEEIANTLKDINKSEELDIERMLFDNFKFTVDELFTNTTARDRVYSKLENISTQLSQNEFGNIKNGLPMTDEEFNKAMEFNNQLSDIKQQATMENKPFLPRTQQTSLAQGQMSEKQFSNEFERTAQKYNIDLENEGIKQIKSLADYTKNEIIFDDTGFSKNQVAKYENGKITINPKADPGKVIQNVVLHEAIHSKSGSKEFETLKKTVLDFAKSKGEEYKQARLDLDNLYRKAYKDRADFDALMDEEVVTNTLGEYFGTEEKLNELINFVDDRTVLQKIYDFVKDVVNSLTGYKDQEQFFRRAERQLAKALQSDYTSKNKHFSIQTNKDGGKYVQVDTDQDIFEGKTKKEQIKIAHDYILQKFREQGLIKDNETVNVTGRTADEFTHPAKKLSKSQYNAKIKASTELDNLLEISKYVRSKEDDGRHIFAKDGWDYYETVFKIGDKTYSGLLNIANGDKGKLLYDITEIEERADNYGVKTVSVVNSSSKFSITSNEDNVNKKQKQLEIIQKNNPMHDDYHTGIRSIDDIKTYQEALEYDEYEGGSLTPDFKEEDLNKALETGEMTVYSSYPIEQGVFVTPSKMEAGSYAGNINKVYSKKIKLSDVAWIDTLQGQYAKVEDTNVVKDNKGRTLSKEQQEYFKDSKVRDENGNLLEVYHGTKTKGINIFNYDPNRQTGTDYGKAYYFTTDYDKAQGYQYDIEKDPLYIEFNRQDEEWKEKVFSAKNEKERLKLIKEWSNWHKENNVMKILDNEEMTPERLPDGETKKLYLNIKNPYIVDAKGQNYYKVYDKYFKEARENGNDGIIVKNVIDNPKGEPRPIDVYIAFNENQIKNVNNTNPTENPDIRYSISQDTRANIESKIDRYTRIVEEMQEEGRDSDEWAPYANEILRLQDQLEDSRYSYQSNGAWNDFVKKYFTSEGTKTTLGQTKLPQRKIELKEYTDLIKNAKNIPEEDKKALKAELKGVQLSAQSLNEFRQTVEELDKVYAEQNNAILDTKQNKNAYRKYINQNTKYDNASLEKAKQIVPANKQGRRTKDQWLNIAKQIGTEIADKSNEEIEQIAYRTWQDERPNNKSSLNRQGKQFVEFKPEEWVNAIYDQVKQIRYSLDTNKAEVPQRRIVEEVYREEIADGKTRKHFKSVFESDQVGEVGKEVAKELYKTNTYTPVSNLETITKVNDNISRNGVDNEYIGFRNKVRSSEKITLEDIATGERLIQIYSQNGDYDRVNELIQDVAILGTELGQQVQAFSLIKRASPEGQLQYLQKVLDRTNLKEGTNLKLTPEQTKQIAESKNEKDLEENLSKVAIQLANQIPLKASDKIRAWRYLSMLGNPKTHIKNLGANVAMNLTQNVKNLISGGIEDVGGLFNRDMQRTKTLRRANKEQSEFAKQDAEDMADLIDAGGKYDVKNIIQSSKRQFDNNVLNAIANFNSQLLDKEDKFFLKLAYKQAMQNYMSANKLKASDMQGETLEKARQYSSSQAQQATFHEFNALANSISEIENKGGIGGVITSAILPFKKTPMNIAKAGVEYSPIGIVKTLSYDLYQMNEKTNKFKKQLAEGKIKQKQYDNETAKMVNKTIDNMAKGLTGTSIMLLGYALAKKGILKAGNDDEGDEFEEKRGAQIYAVTIGDNTYTLDWISPTAIPLFVGATVNQLQNSKPDEKKSAINSALTGLAKSFEPMTEMSMLQGLTSAISSYEQGSSNKIFDLGASMLTSYAGQFIPTALGQVARTIDPYERDTSSTKQGIEGKADRLIRQSANKLPGASMLLPRKQDVWGEDVKRPENVIQRFAENAVLPYSRKEISKDRTDQELLDVFDATGENVLPGTPSKDITISGEKYRMTSEEYNKAKKDFGQTTKDLFDDLITTSEYRTLSSEGKAKAISDVYSYAKEKIKVDYAEKQGQEYKPSSLYNTVSELISQNADVSAYFEFKGKIDDVDRSNGENNVKQKEKLEYLNSMNIDNKTKSIIYEDSFGTSDDNYYNLKVLTNNNVSISDYIDYKTTEIKGIDDPRSNVKGKTISGSKKQAVQNFLNNSSLSGIEQLYIYATQYSLNSTQRAQISNYINRLQITPEEKNNIYKKLSSIEELEDGSIRWK